MAKKFELPKIDNAKLKAVFADVSERAKTAREQAESRRAELAQFNKDNLEALKAAGKIVVDGVKPIANDAVTNTRKQLDAVVANVKDLKELKGKKPAEVVKAQAEVAKTQFNLALEDTKTFGQSVVKLAGEAVEPIKVRVAAVAKREEKLAA